MDAAALLRGIAGMVYPPRCVACAEPVESVHALCAGCWRAVPFLAGASCRSCGAPVPDGWAGDLPCEDCHRHPPGWDSGASAMLYDGVGRKLILALKHGDRLDLVPPVAGWMARAGAGLLARPALVVPVPLHWTRLAKRRFNQAAELSRALAARPGLDYAPELLRRGRATGSQDGKDRATRHANLDGAFRARAVPAGARVLLVDDVMTTGATLSVCAAVLRAAGAGRVDVLVAARVSREGRIESDGRPA